MKFTLSWLKRHLDTDASLETISETLTAIGLEVEDIEDKVATYAPFTVAYVEKAEKHPDADKLKVCQVKTADGMFEVVCGAPNARTGMKGIFAPEGSYIPGLDMTLKKTKIRGVESRGMLVSEKEMCLSDEHDGIIEVSDDFEIGTAMADVFGMNDPVIEIALTPNRADCAGVRGIARDLAAAGLGTLKPLDAAPIQGSFPSETGVSIEDTDGCALFLGRTIKGVQNGPSPDWLQTILKSVGLRPISALVDITNFINLDHARPLHVYDADKLQGDIVVRTARAGERFDALNDKAYETQGGEIAITDDSGLLGLGGIVGGVSSGCTAETVNVYLEAAYFKPERIARAGRDLGVQSDARYRFERGVDPEFTVDGMEIATQMILDLCGGEAGEIVQAGAMPEWRRSIDYNPDYFEQLIGVAVDPAQQKEILCALGFDIADGDTWQITPPPWRGDVVGKADIAEEVVRIVGFDNIPEVSVRSKNTVPGQAETISLSRARIARATLTARGLHESITWSFTSDENAQQFGLNDNDAIAPMRLVNPISSEIDVMRPSILPGLIEAAGRNAARGFTDVSLCEVGPVFKSVKPDGQALVAAGVRAGNNGPRHWSRADGARYVDLYDAKADALATLESCGGPAASAQITRDAPDYYHPGRSGAMRLGKTILAYFGEIHPGVLDTMDVDGPVVGFEVFLDNIPQARQKGTTIKHLNLPPLQPVSRDFAFLVDQNVAASDVLAAAKAADRNLITDAAIFDVYTGKGIEDGQKSLALNVTIQPRDETLTDAALESLSQKIIEMVQKKTGGVLRG